MDHDPRLLDQIRQAGDRGEVEAILILDRGPEPDHAEDGQGSAARLVDRVSRETRETPRSIKYLPKLGALFVIGSGRLIRHLLDQPEVISSSANRDESPEEPPSLAMPETPRRRYSRKSSS